MLRLMLFRHAKSSWTEPGLDDMDRPLTRRGQRAAQAMGRVMAAKRLLPDLVLCSPARRARDTWKLAAEEIKTAPKLIVEDAIYDFGNGGRLIEAVRRVGDKARTVLVVGHNPSMERAAARLAGGGDKKLRERIEQKYPTAALAVIAFDLAGWSGLAECKGEVQHFIRPKDIMGEAE
ncbi:MAG: SixA phosphatase family protein [Hyphomicrobiales bacterium]